MKKRLKIVILTMVFSLVCLCTSASAVAGDLKFVEFSDEYKAYLNLSEEEKNRVVEPSMYDASYSGGNNKFIGGTNILKSVNAVRSAVDSAYTLQNVIPNNVAIKSQASTNSCWAFASIGALETNIALKDYRDGNTNNIYDFSERHMMYGITREFNNSKINPYGFTRKVAEGGNFLHAETYLSNGMGAINETEMPFEDNMNDIDISDIQNKTVTSTLYDTVMFEDLDDMEKDALMLKMKQHITTYGGIYAAVHGAQILSDAYNNNTGAIYCSNSEEYPIDHGVVIIGWDDNYSRDNFKADNKPNNNGAWIVKNSWGSEIRENLQQLKQEFYANNEEELNGIGVYSPNDLTDEYMQRVVANTYGADKVRIENDEIVIEIGNKGFMYISYDDANVYSELFGIQKATGTKDYDHIYQYDVLGSRIAFEYSGNKIYFGNKFNRDASKEELLDKVAVNTMQEATFKVFVNAENDDFSGLQEVRTKSGDSITLEPGYHVIELDSPINLTGDTFIVAVSMETSGENVRIMTENQRADKNVEVNLGESYYTNEMGFNANQWQDWNVENTGENSANVSVKALTNEIKEDVNLEKIEITKAPDKVDYIEGENCSGAGREVTATYSDSSTRLITDYDVVNGKNLALGQTSVTISYTENGINKTTEQAITVAEKTEQINLEKIEITKAPDKVEYIEGENFSGAGMEVTATYSDLSTRPITGYDVVNGKNLTLGQTSVTISYTENGINKTTEQAITVAEKTDPEEPVEPMLSDLENMVTELNGASVYLYKELPEEPYMNLQLTLSNIMHGNEETNYTYYFYLSSSDTEENIENWIRIDAEEILMDDGTVAINFEVDTRDISNIEELNNSDRIYLYIKEVANIGDVGLEQIKVSVLEPSKNTSIIFYLDNQMVGTIDDVIDDDITIDRPDNNGSAGGVNNDKTTAGGIIPQAGVIPIGIVILTIAGIGIFGYIKYKNMYK